MSPLKSCHWQVVGVWTILVGLGTAPAWSAGEPEPRAKPAAAAAEKPAPAAKADPFAVPGGTADELLQYIDGLYKLTPADVGREDRREFQEKRTRAVLEAADKILAGKPGPDQARAPSSIS